MSNIMEHTVFGFCGWDLPALILLIGLVVYFAVRRHKLVKEKKELEEQLSGTNS